jgi:DNA-binding phage protein
MASDDLQYVVRMLAETNLAAVAKKVSLSYGTVYRIARGTNTTPSFATVKKLAEYFRGKE